MIIKRYLVNSMNEAMTRIRYELGKDAVIISQRKVRKPGIAGLFSKKIIEVTAAVENIKKNEEELVQNIEAIKQVMKKQEFQPEIRPESKGKTKVRLDTGFETEKAPVRSSKKEEMSVVSEKEASPILAEEMRQMKELLYAMMSKGNSQPSKEKSELEIMLESSDVADRLIETILKKVKDPKVFSESEQEARGIIADMVAVKKATLQGTMVLVGPTGVGKTTTIAKLAGRLALIEKKRVGLITVDTYRIGAVEQLKTYADIMNIPFKVVLTLKEMEFAIESMAECDIILIDTTGRSSKNAMQISELRAFVEKAMTSNIHLVLSCTTKNRDIEAIIEGYRVLNYNHVIITKLDETTTYGSILNILDLAKKPLSYVTTGQNVPDDIKEITVAEISNLILGEDSVC